MEQHIGLNRMIAGPMRFQAFLDGLRARAASRPLESPADRQAPHRPLGSPILADIRPGDEVFRVDLKNTPGLRVLIAHRDGREIVFLDTGSATYSLGAEEQKELLKALEEMDSSRVAVMELNRISDKPRMVKGFLFTGRQLEILRLASRGETNIRISRILSISISTVKRELRQVFDELNVSGRADAAVKAHREAII